MLLGRSKVTLWLRTGPQIEPREPSVRATDPLWARLRTHLEESKSFGDSNPPTAGFFLAMAAYDTESTSLGAATEMPVVLSSWAGGYRW